MSLKGRMVRKMGRVLPAAALRALGRPAAVFFHGVEPEIHDPELQSNHHRLEDFHAIARSLRRDFDVAPLSVLADVLRRPERHRRTIFLMSDDGYANTLSIAAPVLADLQLPWALFVSTEHIDTAARNPVFLARRFLRHAPDGTYRIPHLREPVRLNESRHQIAEEMVDQLRRLPLESVREAVGAMTKAVDASAAAFESERFLTWNEVRALSQRGVTIGAHAHWHCAMHAGERADTLRRQAEQPRQRIEAEVGPCRYFAYPFGNKGDVCAAAWRAVRAAGYDYAFTTLSGTLNARQNRWLLPRYGLEQRELNLPATLPLLRLGNVRVAQWQRSLA
jgi:peptidoglycan/xylan/chitin deacetylase (PgdA/CDA1 family)